MVSLDIQQHEVKQTSNNWLNSDSKPHGLHSTFSDYLVLGNFPVSLKLGLKGKEPHGLPPNLFGNHLPV